MAVWTRRTTFLSERGMTMTRKESGQMRVASLVREGQPDIGQNLRTYRKRCGFTQKALAKALGVTTQAVSRWERGNCYPDLLLLPKIAAYFDISIDQLFEMP